MTNPAEMTLEPTGETSFGPCECCGQMTKRIWGYVYQDGAALAACYVEWNPGHGDKEATFDLILGHWGEGTSSSDRRCVSLSFRVLDTGPAFMVINSSARAVATSNLVGKAIDRMEVIGHTIAGQVFAICDCIYLDDPRLAWMRDTDYRIRQA